MARDVEALVLLMDANINKFTRKLEEAQGKFDKTARAIERRQRELDKNLARLGAKAGDLYRPVQVGAALATGAIVALSYEAAKRAEAVNGAFRQIFRDMPAEAARTTAAISTEFGRLETDIKDNFTQLGGVLAGLGVGGEQALTIIDQLQRRALDLAAFRDVADADAFAAVISGLTGETEPLKRFGLVVNETAVKAELLRLGFKGNAQQAPEAAKAIARANLILAKSAEIHGQVARESDTLAEQEKRTRAEFTKSAEQFGQQFLPVAAEVLDWATDALAAFNDLPSGTQNAALGLLALVAVGGPILSVIKGLKDLIGAAVAARGAMAALGASGAAGAAGGAGGRGLATLGTAAGLGVGGAVALGTGLLVGTASFAPAPYRGDDLTRQLEQAQRDQRQADALAADTFLKRRGVVEQQRESAQRAAARVASLQQQIARRQQTAQQAEEQRVQAEADAVASSALAGLGNFQLSGNQTSPVGGGTGGGGSRQGASAAEAEALRIAERRETLALERAIDLARASGDERSVRAAEERQRLAQLTADYEDAGYADARAQATEHINLLNTANALTEDREKAEEEVDLILEGRRRQMEREADYQQQVNDQLTDRLAMEAQLATLRGDSGVAEARERELWVAERVNELLALRPGLSQQEAQSIASEEAASLDDATTRGRFRDLVVEAGRDFGSLTERAGEGFKRRALEGLADALFNIVNAALSSTGGGGLKSLLDFLPGFDSGGYTGPGPRSKPAGVVHAGEVVFSQADVARLGGPATVDAIRRGLRGYASGGVVGFPAMAAMQSAMATANRVRTQSAAAQVTFAPVYNVTGSGPEIAALRQQMARDKAEIPSIAVAAVAEGQQRRIGRMGGGVF